MNNLNDTASSSFSISSSVEIDLIEEQRNEISNAKTLNSDLDYAFNLQLQEAISASLSSFPDCASSSRTVPLPSPSPSPSPSPDELDYTDLLLQDIERLEQERRDREAVEALKQEMISGLDRCLHDQRLAGDIMVIPEEEWRNYGDNYQRPYEESVTIGEKNNNNNNNNNLVLVGMEEFRVYCKGVESEERVRDKRVIVCGLGVAICDSRDNVRFEVSKRGLGGGGGEEIGKGKDKGKVGKVVGLEVEVEAIVEGLGAALSLDLKRVAFFCDDFLLFQYVTGRLQPNQGRISVLVNEVSRLQRCFTSCRPLLVSRNDFKFAFKLARDAIVSQITWSVETSNGKKNLKETCIICYEDTDVEQMFSVDGCLHRYCFSCMKQHVEVKLLNGMEAKCPDEGCNSQVSIHTCEKFMDHKLVKIMIQRKNEALIAVTEKVYCLYPKCSALMSKAKVLEYTRSSFVGADQCGARKCMSCNRFFCINCKVPWHYDVSCNDYRKLNPHPSREDAMLESLAKNKLWRQCGKCNQMVELAFGCYHIICRCGYEFCYTCGAEWKNKAATCKCPIWDERNIIRDRRRR